MTAKPALYLEDLAVGQRYGTGSVTIDAEQIKTFAGQFDPQPFHTDEEQAKHTFFQGLAASGWHTAGLTMRLIATGEMKLAWGHIGGTVEITWPRPTRPGDTLQVETEVLELIPSRSKPDRGMAVVRHTTRNQHGEPVQVLLGKLVVPRRQSATT